MLEFKEDQIKMVLSIAKNVRHKYSDLLYQANLAERARILAHQRRYAEKLFASTDCDVDELDKIRAWTQTEIRQFLQKQKAAVLKRSSSVKDTLHYSIDSQRKARECLVSLRKETLPSDINFNFVVLDTPLFIIPSQDINLAPPSKAPWNNVAKINAGWSTPYPDNGFDDLSFVFVWENPSDRNIVVNVASYLMLNGFCDVLAEAGASDIFSPHSSALGFTVELGVLEYWNNPPTSPSGQVGQFASVLGLNADGGGIFGFGDYESSGVSGIYDVTYGMFQIPPKGVTVFVVRLLIGHYTNGGFIEVDFASGDFEVMCPALVIAILT